MALESPTQRKYRGAALPAIEGMLFTDEQNPTQRFFQFKGLEIVNYREVIKSLLQFIPGKWEAYDQEKIAKNYKEQNPTADSSEALFIPRVFKEIKNQDDFKEVCTSHKGCAIGLLPAITTIDSENESFQQKVALLAELDEKAGKNMSPIHYTWLNATCHEEAFKYFDVDPTMLPTVVFMSVNNNIHASMIGKFDKDTILEHERRFKHAKVPVKDIKVDPNEVIFRDIDCAAQTLDSPAEDDEDIQEFLAEVRAEEKARKDATERSNQPQGKKKGKKGKAKGKKGGKKKNFNPPPNASPPPIRSHGRQDMMQSHTAAVSDEL